MNKELLEKITNKKTVIIFNAIYFIFTLFPLCVVESQSGYGEAYHYYNA